MTRWGPARFYLVAGAAFFAILANALYGDMVFGYFFEEKISKYSVYVHFMPEWRSHPGNVVFEVTNVWDSQEGADNIPYNSNTLDEIAGRGFVELWHEYDSCAGDWHPILYRYGIDHIRNVYESLLGADISVHPYAVMYPDIPSDKKPVTSHYVQYVPLCGDGGSYLYSLSSNADIPLDVAFGPESARDEFARHSGMDLACRTDGHSSLSGRCDVQRGDGMLIRVPDSLDMSLTKIVVNLYRV